MVLLLIPSEANAQNFMNGYINVDWQLNQPVGNSFANKVSGWGAHAEAGYYITPEFSIGGFVSFHTNNKYLNRRTLDLGNNGAITSDQQHSIFQIPFGAALRYTFERDSYSIFEPYVGAKIGTNYSEVSTYMNIYKNYERKWGFYISPEIGFTIYTSPEKRFGFHVATFYSYSTNKSSVLIYDVNGLQNVGVRLGIAF